MTQLLTANTAINLYWFGRNIERIETSLLEVSNAFDESIDNNKYAGKELFAKLGIDIEYSSASSFLQNAIFGNHNANLNNIMEYARENAIISRTHIDTKAFGEVIELASLFESTKNSAYEVDYRFIDNVLSLISEIWGELTHRMQRQSSDYFIRLGKLTEKVDFHLRLGGDIEFAKVIEVEIDSMIKQLTDEYTPIDIDYYDIDSALSIINSKIDLVIKN
jgi:uncharacterized alpha-E superfamily protein